MAEKRPQNYKNHPRFVPGYHTVLTLLWLAFTIWTILRLVQNPSLDTGALFVLAIAMMLTIFYARVFALKAQDRVIRLEERLRMHELFDEELKGHIGDFSTSQLVALRFASDEELPDLAREVLSEGTDDQKAIKQKIKNWRPDYQRV